MQLPNPAKSTSQTSLKTPSLGHQGTALVQTLVASYLEDSNDFLGVSSGGTEFLADGPLGWTEQHPSTLGSLTAASLVSRPYLSSETLMLISISANKVGLSATENN